MFHRTLLVKSSRKRPALFIFQRLAGQFLRAARTWVAFWKWRVFILDRNETRLIWGQVQFSFFIMVKIHSSPSSLPDKIQNMEARCRPDIHNHTLKSAARQNCDSLKHGNQCPVLLWRAKNGEPTRKTLVTSLKSLPETGNENTPRTHSPLLLASPLNICMWAWWRQKTFENLRRYSQISRIWWNIRNLVRFN